MSNRSRWFFCECDGLLNEGGTCERCEMEMHQWVRVDSITVERVCAEYHRLTGRSIDRPKLHAAMTGGRPVDRAEPLSRTCRIFHRKDAQ